MSADIVERGEGLPAVKRWRHKKRGSTYVEIGRGTSSIAGDTSIADEEPVVVYRCEQDGRIWVRPVDEFEDGRFEALASAPASDERSKIRTLQYYDGSYWVVLSSQWPTNIGWTTTRQLNPDPAAISIDEVLQSRRRYAELLRAAPASDEGKTEPLASIGVVPKYTREQLVRELNIRADGGYEDAAELQIMCRLAANALATPIPAVPAVEGEAGFTLKLSKLDLQWIDKLTGRLWDGIEGCHEERMQADAEQDKNADRSIALIESALIVAYNRLSLIKWVAEGKKPLADLFTAPPSSSDLVAALAFVKERLEWMNRKGGLGHKVHEEIDSAIAKIDSTLWSRVGRLTSPSAARRQGLPSSESDVPDRSEECSGQR